jgi:hypothetical protein
MDPAELDEAARMPVSGGGPFYAATYRGLRIEARVDGDELVLAHNLGGAGPPTRARAFALIGEIRAFCAEAIGRSAGFAKLARERRVRVELYVFSGHMDFPVADATESGTRFYVELA